MITGNGGGLQNPAMKAALVLGFVAFTLLVSLLVWLRARVELATNRLARVERDAIDLELDSRVRA